MGEVLIHTNSEVTSTAREDSLAARSTSAGHLRSLSLLLSLLRLGPLLILIVMITSASALSPYFLTPRNISNVLAQTVVIATLALGQYVVILTRGIDLSVGSNIALCSVIGALALPQPPGSRRHQLIDPRDLHHAGDRWVGWPDQRRSICLWPLAASVHHHACNAQHMQGARVRVIAGADHFWRCASGSIHWPPADFRIAFLGFGRRRDLALPMVRARARLGALDLCSWWKSRCRSACRNTQ